MLENLNKILSKIPLNGKKTITGILVSVVVLIFPDFPQDTFSQAIELIIQIIGLLGNLLTLIGLLHKWVKIKLGY